MFVLEDLVVKKYATGEQTFGTSWMLSSDSGFESLKQVIVHEKHVKVMKKMGAYVVIMLCKQRPDALTEEMIVAFVKPDVVEELERIGSFENKKRISVKGEVTKVLRMPQVPTCTICANRFCDTFFVPCGDIACAVCTAELEERGSQCHICRESFTSTSKLY
uniref:RING-type domain-containing protein n=1 Tax=Magallana gigas TaxID=29159 RepID=A0A8W8MIY5_MAGGI